VSKCDDIHLIEKVKGCFFPSSSQSNANRHDIANVPSLRSGDDVFVDVPSLRRRDDVFPDVLSCGDNQATSFQMCRLCTGDNFSADGAVQEVQGMGPSILPWLSLPFVGTEPGVSGGQPTPSLRNCNACLKNGDTIRATNCWGVSRRYRCPYYVKGVKY
jgi:hypothetical protein